jgi:hypothetical protein
VQQGLSGPPPAESTPAVLARNRGLGERLPLSLQVVRGLAVSIGRPRIEVVCRRRGEMGGMDARVELGLKAATSRWLAAVA